ncbi:GNAT family N-acetyltransferase [Paractinoplanes toevensis]|uniref:N-acetyltransferase domain-containing protein n=1 Tax=Paractinoplanes toevensis TaxID=571911 RepID=A0A920BQF1_9ACTN|nr:GNAT family N-acetyltransferase [Actinoplanes toevensis]GIM97035.1 hypothetical protein Ato02nite_088280 [Actinoplanes toevensis]
MSERASAAEAGEIAALTRAAYAAGDPFPGLPVPDGARETAASVRADLRAGALVWVVRDPAGRLTGVLRVHPHAGEWEISRVATDPARRRTGAARALLSMVDEAAVAAGIARIRLDAVVERCLPPFYARLGYRPERHWLPGDKPLSEVSMIRSPGTPVTAGPAWLPPGPEAALVVTWLLDDRGLTAVIGTGTATAGPGARLAGVDVHPDPGRHDEVLAGLARHGRPAGAEVHFPVPRAQLRAHLMPRTVHPDLHARYRPAPGAEPLVTTTVAR